MHPIERLAVIFIKEMVKTDSSIKFLGHDQYSDTELLHKYLYSYGQYLTTVEVKVEELVNEELKLIGLQMNRYQTLPLLTPEQEAGIEALILSL